MIARFKGMLSAPKFHDEEKARLARLMNILLWTALVAAAIVVVTRWLAKSEVQSVDYVPALSIIAAAAVGLWALRRGNVSLPGWLLLSALYLASAYGLFTSGGLRTANSSVFVLIVAMAALLLGRGGAVCFALLGLGAMSWFYVADRAGLLIVSNQALTIDRIVVPALILIVTAMTLDLIVRVLRESLLRARRNEHKLAIANRELKAFSVSLEERVAERTRKLTFVTDFGERLSTLVNLIDLLDELTEAIQKQFGYYYVQLLMLDERSRELVVKAGSGPVGREMKANRFGISLEISLSPVARAARQAEVVRFDNLRAVPDWFPNPLLPQTIGQLDLPIIVQNEVVGVLDIHTDRANGIAEEDISLLRSLVNHLAGVIRRNQLFAEIDAALVEARAAQARYLAETWDRQKLSEEAGQYLYLRAAEDLDEAGQEHLRQAKQAALQQTVPTLLPALFPLNSTEVARPDELPQRSITAPIILHDHPIGHLQLHPAAAGKPWSKDDLAMVQVIVNQLAQAAESLRLFEEARSRARFERRVSDISTRLHQASTLDLLAKVAAEEIGAALGASHGLVKIGQVAGKR